MKGLEGIKVVELTGYVAAPACPRILGEMGATIYKIEPFSGDEYRTNGPGFGMQKTDIDDPAFDLASMNKEFLSVNLKDPEGAAFVEKLLADADVMITSFRDNALKKLGLDYEAVHARHPHLVWAQMRNTVLSAIARDSTPRPMVLAAASSPRCRKPITSSPSTGRQRSGIGTPRWPLPQACSVLLCARTAPGRAIR